MACISRPKVVVGPQAADLTCASVPASCATFCLLACLQLVGRYQSPFWVPSQSSESVIRPVGRVYDRPFFPAKKQRWLPIPPVEAEAAAAAAAEAGAKGEAAEEEMEVEVEAAGLAIVLARRRRKTTMEMPLPSLTHELSMGVVRAIAKDSERSNPRRPKPRTKTRSTTETERSRNCSPLIFLSTRRSACMPRNPPNA